MTIAEAPSAIRLIIRGRPSTSTNTTGLPVAATAAASFNCASLECKVFDVAGRLGIRAFADADDGNVEHGGCFGSLSNIKFLIKC